MPCGANGADYGIDLARQRVAVYWDLKRKCSLNNLQVYQLPIELVNELGRLSDQIVMYRSSPSSCGP